MVTIKERLATLEEKEWNHEDRIKELEERCDEIFKWAYMVAGGAALISIIFTAIRLLR